MIEVKNVCKSFGEHEVLKNVNICFEDDAVYCLMGESGIGKTTLLRIIMGLETPDSGSVRICGNLDESETELSISADKKHTDAGADLSVSADKTHVDTRTHFAAMFQEDRLIEDRTPVDNVYFVTKGQTQYSDKQNIEKHKGRAKYSDWQYIGKAEELSKYSDKLSIEKALLELLPQESIMKPVSKLSGGQRRRTALARAVLSDRPIVLLDEPFTGLDDESRVMAIRFIQHYRANRTVVVVTHQSSDADVLNAQIVQL